MRQFFADLHIHVGVSSTGSWIKIPTSRNLTVENIVTEASDRKGMDIIGIVDALSPLVLNDFEDLIRVGKIELKSGGGYQYLDSLTVILGAEIETTEEHGGTSHTLVYLPDIKTMRVFSKYMSAHIRNINLSSQNARMSLKQLIQIASSFEAVIIPAHVFTPHKSLFGVCCSQLDAILTNKEIDLIDAFELGLSADSQLADRLAELNSFSFLTNSDAHSLAKIAREYSVLSLETASFEEYRKALRIVGERKVAVNYGLDPRLGKYHRTFCSACGHIITDGFDERRCSLCGSAKLINGVFDRINQIADYDIPRHPIFRAPYLYQIPLEFIPGLGKKAMEKLLHHFGTEMRVIHNASKEELAEVVGGGLANNIVRARSGQATIDAGGGGLYGKIIKS